MIQLKVRTEFSFRSTFAPLDRVVARLKEVGATHAGMVDLGGSTWGHVRWEAALRKAGVVPMFGFEIGVAEKAPEEGAQAPSAWALATDPSAMYRSASLAHSRGSGTPFLTVREFLEAPGLVKFTGSALLDRPEAVEAGCWIDLNPGSILGAQRALSLARRTGGRLVLTGDNLFPAPADRKLFELLGNNAKTTPQHILAEAEMRAAFAKLLTPKQLGDAIEATREAAEKVGEAKLRRAPLIKIEGDVEALCRAGAKKRLKAKQIAKWTPEYEARLKRELALVKEKEFDSYFLMVADMVVWAKQHMLVGPARGSSAGSLMCYLMEITEVDPMPHGLMFERFVDVTRKDLPDIDIDFPDEQRDRVYDYLREKYGSDKVARIGTISELGAKSALGQVAKRLGIPPWETQAVKDAMFVRSSGDSRANNCLADTLSDTEPGRNLVSRFPAINLSGEIEGHASHSGVHAAGVIVCNVPIVEFCAVVDGVAQLDKKDAESLNLLKVDALGLRTLSVLEDAGVMSREGFYHLKLTDKRAFDVINRHKYCGIFQWEGAALQSLTSQVRVDDFDTMAHITALARPGPLGGGAASKFADRKAGKAEPEVAHKSMWKYLDDTYGLVIYQEQVMSICREIGLFNWEDASAVRKMMSQRKGIEAFSTFKQKFIDGAAKSVGLSERAAADVWEQIDSMGAWAFNKSHSVAYAIVSYWTAWTKCHHPLEFAASSLRHAKDDETAKALLREMIAEGFEYVAFDPELSELNWTAKGGKLIGGFLGLKGIGPSKAAELIAARAAGGWSDKQRAMVEKAEPIFADLYPTRSRWGAYFDDPEGMGLKRGTRLTTLADLPAEGGEVVVIGQLAKKDGRDKNEAILVAKRNGKLFKSPTAFLDMRIVDDTTMAPFLIRIDRYEYEPAGRLILERGREGHDWFLIRGQKLANIPMISAEKVRCLNDPDLLREDRKEREHD